MQNADAKTQFKDNMLAGLLERNGDIHWDERVLTKREAKMATLPAPGSLACTTPKQKAVADFVLSANHEESRASDLAFAKNPPQNMIEKYHLLEEMYHSRIFAQCGRALGGDAPAPKIPMTRAFLVEQMILLPEKMRRPLLFCGEVLGTTIVYEIRRLVERHFPNAREIVSLIDDIITDEIGHMQYNWIQLGPAGKTAARAAYPLVLQGMVHSFPDLDDEFKASNLRKRYAGFRPELLAPDLAGRIWGNPAVALPAW